MVAAIGPKALLATPGYLRLWLAGGFANAMRWLEILVAGIFTFQTTGSALLVAVVTVARTLPLLIMGALAGMPGEALNHKALLFGGLCVMTLNSAVLGILAASVVIRIWHSAA